MVCKNIYRYANLLAVLTLLLSIGLNFGVKVTAKSSTPDTFPLPLQTEPIPTLNYIEEKSHGNIYTTLPKPKTSTNTKTASTNPSTAITSIKISGYTYPVFSTDSLGKDPGTRVALYQNQFLFAHSSGPFSILPGASTFQLIRTNGSVENYQIVKKIVYCDYTNIPQYDSRYKDHSYDCSNYPEPTLPVRIWGDVGDYYDARAFGYDFILMTCAGQNLPGGDATHRLLAYAKRI